MIISASRRTDIPAFYSDWFVNRIQAGYCTVVNPFNRKQVSCVSLKPENVDVIVFWSKNPAPLLPHLHEMDERGYRYYFQFTLNGYPRELEPGVPLINQTVDIFKKLADRIGPERVIWRYDPIMISNITTVDYHKRQLEFIARELEGKTGRLVVSILDEYRKNRASLKFLQQNGIYIKQNPPEMDLAELIPYIVDLAADRGMEAFSCAEVLDLKRYGLTPGKCIDNHYIRSVFGIEVNTAKDRSQRAECGCVQSKDIGVYNTCRHGCRYCYAGTPAAAERNWARHFPDSSSLLDLNT